MTLLVGMVGSDGIVLAADQRKVDSAKNDTEIDDFMDGCKIQNFAEQKIACAYCGDRFSEDIGMEINSACQKGNFNLADIQSSLKAVGEQGMREVYKTAQNPNSVPDRTRELLVVFYGSPRASPELWRLTVNSWYNSGMPAFANQAQSVERTTMVGARGNSARYFQRYFEDDLPIEKLKTLAAQIVLAGHKIDNLIDGLDIALIRRDNFILLNATQKAPLRAISQKIEEFIIRSMDLR